jgi:metal-responsive CopG/Arc/MetJ family transcriptional regulator
MRQTKYLSARIPEALFEQLDDEAESLSESRTEVLVKALKHYFSRESQEESSGTDFFGLTHMLTTRMNELESRMGSETKTLAEKINHLEQELQKRDNFLNLS